MSRGGRASACSVASVRAFRTVSRGAGRGQGDARPFVTAEGPSCGRRGLAWRRARPRKPAGISADRASPGFRPIRLAESVVIPAWAVAGPGQAWSRSHDLLVRDEKDRPDVLMIGPGPAPRCTAEVVATVAGSPASLARRRGLDAMSRTIEGHGRHPEGRRPRTRGTTPRRGATRRRTRRDGGAGQRPTTPAEGRRALAGSFRPWRAVQLSGVT